MKLRKIYLFLGFAIILLGFFWGYFPAISRYRELRIQEETIDQEIAQLDAKIQDLQAEKEQLTEDPEYLEKIIRDELGLVKPGEIVYKFVKEPPESLASNVKTAQLAAASLPVENPPKQTPPSESSQAE